MRKDGNFRIFPRGRKILFISVKSISSLALTVWIICLFIPSAAQEASKIKIETDAVNLDVIVNDLAGKRIYDLTQEDFEVYEDGVLQKITSFKPARRPLRLILLFDMSYSMGPIFTAIRDEALKSVEGLNQLDELMVATFDTDLRWLTDWAGKGLARTEISNLRLGSGPSQPLSERLPLPPTRRTPADTNTNLYGALHTLFERFGGRDGNEVALLFSDGVDKIHNRAPQRPIDTPKQAVQRAQESWTQIYCACVKNERKKSWNSIPIGKTVYGSNCKFLSEVADATGGRSFEFDSQPELAQVIKKTIDELKNQYCLVYSPSSQGNRAGFHKIKVVVKKTDLVAKAREGYFISK